MDDTNLWQTKLHARLHDPAEKALVLLRDPAGHEGGTSRALHRLLGFDAIGAEGLGPETAGDLHRAVFKDGIPADIYATVRRADRWAAAADRPQWPLEEVTRTTQDGATRTFKVADWAQVNWSKRPVLIHPLSGAEYDLGRHGGLADTELADIKGRSLRHFASLAVRTDGALDWRRTLLAYWRFGPEIQESKDFGTLGALWRLLPADTRVPDHSIWDHLDLASAFAGAFAADEPAAGAPGEAALLALAIGPVQGFIAAARSTSDLWAGSHLLARLAWEAMRPVCETLGPDAILFPRLRGVPQVDLWLRDDCGLAGDLFKGCPWTQGSTDSNPLFAAALPNRFVALVPRSQARAIALRVETRVRDWFQGLGAQVVDRLLEAAGLPPEEVHAHRQMREQVAGFPEVHWAAVPFSLIRPRDPSRETDLDTLALSEAMAPFFAGPSATGAGGGAGDGTEALHGFLAGPAWRVLRRETRWDDGTAFFAPNPGVLYPAVHDLAERVLAAAKSLRTFEQTRQVGWRCALTGETEWLTTDPAQLTASYRTRDDTLWAAIAKRRRAWARPGEHLGALPAIKRLWPTLFAEEVGARRFVVSTHTMALAHQLDQWLGVGGGIGQTLKQALDRHDPDPVALPKGLLRRYGSSPALDDAKRLAGLLDRAAELDDEAEAERLRWLIKETLVGKEGRLETYYALILLDGDRMGAWLSDQPPFALRYQAGFHPQVRAGFAERAGHNGRLRDYAEAPRAPSPGRHLAISGALNDFSLHLVPHIVEVEHLGRVIYAGGDDVLAMVPVADLLPALQRLRLAYSGHDPAQESGERSGLALRDGFALLDGRLMRLMGTKATASAGAVIAHHQAPLGAVLRELRAAEHRAKDAGGRDALSLTLLKRSGGTLHFTAKWGEALSLIADLGAFLADPGVSRRAVYNSLDWLKDLAEPQDDGAMLERLLAYQLARQSDAKATRDHHDVPGLARRLAALALVQPRDRLSWLRDCLLVAEFLAREGRGGARGQ